MNLTENEIRNLPPEHKQKLVIELRGIKVGDRAYPNAKAIIDTITNQKGWKEPEKYKVKALENVLVDDRAVQKDQETEVYVWQYRALSRFFELLDDKVKSGLEAAGEKVRKERSQTVAAQAAAAVIALLLVLFGFQANAQSKYTPVVVAGFDGVSATASVPASTLTNFNIATVSTNTVTNVTWSAVNGVATPSYTTNYITTTNVPGLVNLTLFDDAPVLIGLALTGAGTTAIPTYWSLSPDGTHWASNAVTISVTPAGTAQVWALGNLFGTNKLFGSMGYARLDAINNANTAAATNIYIGIPTKPYRSGR